MHLTSAVLTFSLASLSLLSHAFPLVPQQPAIRRRVAYSVVAVDGGSAATSSPTNTPAVTTLFYTSDQTETITAPAVTLPASTKTVISTAEARESEPAKTVAISVTLDITRTVVASSPSATASPKPPYTMVNAGGTPSLSKTVILTTQTSTASTTVDCTSSIAVPTPTSTVMPTSIPPSTFTSTSPSASTSAISHLAPAASTSPLATPSTINTSLVVYSAPPAPSTAALGAGLPPMEAPIPVGLAPPFPSGFMTSIARPTTTSRTYDNGVWHTRYPSWNATSATLSSSATAALTRGAHNIWNK